MTKARDLQGELGGRPVEDDRIFICYNSSIWQGALIGCMLDSLALAVLI